ncbi:SURF1 family protein [Streptomyces polyrhachis]|uniref:SURF1-like protein n=1 Tax=Streptomyces polyrhachis TaxID=1282885 RepID=A0ABW2GBW2_9ACTN
MYRFLAAPRWWAINAFALLAVAVCFVMGSWQLGRFEDRVDSHQRQEQGPAPADRRARPVAELLPVDKSTSGRLVTARGSYGAQLLVPGRTLDGRRGFYVLTLLRTDGTDGTGSRDSTAVPAGTALPVVRGWLPGDADSAADRARIPAAPAGTVTVRGALQASETQGAPGVHAAGALPEGQLGMISAASLINIVDQPVTDAWITLTEGEGALTPVPPAAAQGTGLDLKAFQNLGYTAEWFVFAGFVVFMWSRFFRRELELARDAELGLTPPDPGEIPGPGEHPDGTGRDGASRSPAPAPTA